jgi:signal transduction histidine kinase
MNSMQHNLKTPLNAISLLSQVALEGPEENQRELIEDIYRNALILGNLVDQIHLYNKK